MKFVEQKDVSILHGITGYEFDWSLRSSAASVTVSNEIDGVIAGLVEFERMPREMFDFMHLIEVHPDYRGTDVAGQLLAFVGQDSLNNGFDGFVVWESKTLLYEYYIVKYGAKPLVGRRLHFDTAATKQLIKRYLGGEDDE
ncbi:MAG: hypothetical protein LBG97_08235 [Coriobacteriales bacterium]|jgi:GNAT superfamily N-acetyltransferase|nr:hypothetical protein [Coriobacteriales bacterium]